MAPSATFLRLQDLGRRTGATDQSQRHEERNTVTTAQPNDTRVKKTKPIQGFPSSSSHASPDDSSLPSCEALEKEFGLFDRGGDDTASQCTPCVDTRGRVSCACVGCARWMAYVGGTLRADCLVPACEGSTPRPWPTWPQYEVLTREHVAALADYLRSRAAHYCPTHPHAVDGHRRPLRVLEVGAGDGRLAHYLRKAIRTLDDAEKEREYEEEEGRRGGHTEADGSANDRADGLTDGERIAAARAISSAAPSVEIFATDSNTRGLANAGTTPHASSVLVVDALDAIVGYGVGGDIEGGGGGVFPLVGDHQFSASQPSNGVPGGGAAGAPSSLSPQPCDIVLACWQPMGVGRGTDIPSPYLRPIVACAQWRP